MTAAGGGSAPDPTAPACRVRTVLGRIGDKWAIYVVDGLGDGPRRFTELLRGIDGITARMLTVTLRGLERDGLVTRTMHPIIPPRVDYELTPMGATLLETIQQLMDWADGHAGDIYEARRVYDAERAPTEAPCPDDEPPCPGEDAGCDG